MSKPLVIEHEPYSVDLLSYQILLSLGNKQLPFNRFSGRRVRQDSRRLQNVRGREKRLRKHGMSVVMFAS